MLKSLLMVCFLWSCQVPTDPVYPVTPQVAANSTFMVEVAVNSIPIGYGTGWIVENKLGTNDLDTRVVSYLITAGHVCRTLETPGYVSYTLHGKDGQSIAAEIVKRSDDPDLCLLQAFIKLGPPLLIAQRDPYYGEPITYVGAPAVKWGDGMAPILHGFYSGGNLITIPTFPGASGSAAFTSYGVVGVVVAYDPRFHHLGYMVDRATLVDFLK